MSHFLKPLHPRARLLAGWLLLLAVQCEAQVVVQVGQNFTGTSYGNYNTNSAAIPPDANGAVGPNHFVEFINGMFRVYSKTNGHQVRLMTDVDFWANAGVGIDVQDGWDVSDPRIIYDPLSQRWFASEVDVDGLTQALGTFGANDFLLAVSKTADPTGEWQGIAFESDPDNGNFADFPTLGVDSQGVYLSGDMYDANGDATNPSTPDLGPSLVSFPKANLLADPIIPDHTWFGIMNISARGQVLQPVSCADGSSTGTVLATGDIGSTSSPHTQLVTFAVQNVAQPVATLSPATFITVSPYIVPDNAVAGFPLLTATQPDGTSTLMANDARFSAKVYAVGGVLYAVHNTEFNGHIAIRWYRIRVADGAVLESGTISDPNLDLIFPSIAANTSGTVVMAFNGSGRGTLVSCYALPGATLNGVTTFGSRILLQTGATSYHGDDEVLYGTSRWGDYSATSVDPSDPNRFWTIQMYPSDVDVWSTQITELLTCVPQLSIQLSGTNALVSWPGTAVPFNLESNTSLTAANNWTLVAQSFTTNYGQISVLVPLTAGPAYFRLHKP